MLEYPVLALVTAKEDEDAAIEWIGSPAFQADYNEASRLLMVRDQKASN